MTSEADLNEFTEEDWRKLDPARINITIDQAERERLFQLRDALEQALDDMGDGCAVCQATKELMRAALDGKEVA